MSYGPSVEVRWLCPLFAVLLQGGAFLQSSMKISSNVSGVLQGIILFFVLGSEFFIQYSIARKTKSAGGGGDL